jgi:beta-glucosidase
MFRFSLDFGRLCPKEGEFNSELMGEYIKALGLVRAHGQEPMLTIYHWPMPRYLLETNNQGDVTAGGWENPEVSKHFRFYVENVIKYLADQDRVKRALEEEGFDKNDQDRFLSEGLARYFLSINEPVNILFSPYITGIFPPYKKGRVDLVKGVLEKLVEAHDIARDQIKSGALTTERGDPQVGIAHNWPYFDGALGDIAHSLVNKKISDRFERNGEYTDFLGLQSYFRLSIPSFSRKGREYSDNPYFGDIYPPGMYENLKKMHQQYPGKEIFVSEMGFSDKTDKRRPYWILETTRYVIEALKAGVPVKGMLLWSLVNNFEWNLGMDQKYGLFDEAELKNPPTSTPGAVRSWEVWSAVTKALTDPSAESLQKLQDIYVVAKQQFEKATGSPD